MSVSYETTGIIHSIGATTEYGQNGFTKREFVILLSGEGENPEYPNHVQFELVKDKCVLMDAYQAGNEIKVGFNLGGRIWEGNGQGEKCFVSLQAWKMELINIGQVAQPQQAPPQQQAPQQAPPTQQPQDHSALINNYKNGHREKQLAMWATMSPEEQAAVSAAM